MFVRRVLAMAVSSAALLAAPLSATAGQPVAGAFLVHTRLINGPEVVFTNRYAALVGFTVPRACRSVGGIAYSDSFIVGERKGRVYLDGIYACPQLLAP